MTERILQSDDLDRLGQALVTLTREVWVLKDRQRILEAVLIDAGIIDRNAVDSHQPDDRLMHTLKAERKQLIDTLIDSLVTSDTKEHRDE